MRQIIVAGSVMALAIGAGLTIVGSTSGDQQGSSGAEATEHMAHHSHAKSERHGGSVAMTKAHHFESVWYPDGIRIYVYSAAQAPLVVGKAAGTVTFKLKDGSSQEVKLARESPAAGEKPTVYFCPMHPEVVQMEPGICTKCGDMKLMTQDRLVAKLALSEAEPGSVKAVVKMTGLSGKEAETTFTETFQGFAKHAAGEHAGEHEHDGGHEHAEEGAHSH